MNKIRLNHVVVVELFLTTFRMMGTMINARMTIATRMMQQILFLEDFIYFFSSFRRTYAFYT